MWKAFSTFPKEKGRIYVEAEGAFDYEEAVAALQRVFGIVGICPVVIVEREGFEELSSHVMSYVKEMYGGQKKTFKVHTRRAHKGFPMESMEVNAELGGEILDEFPEMTVDVHKPDVTIHIEILRQNLHLFRSNSGTRAVCPWNQWTFHASLIRRYRQSGSRIYGGKTRCLH